MELQEERQDGKLILHLAGKIDGSNADAFRQAVADHIDGGDRSIVLDFSRLEYLSSAGLRSVLLLAKRLKSEQGGFALCCMSDLIKGVFDVSGFSKILPIYRTRAEALAAV
jgi:stage II sporulation protein AA (anti-sigma F factor antagonist)